MSLIYTKSPLFRKHLYFTLFLFSLLSINPTFSQQLAFPSAKGGGAYATGGRGYPVFFVTNLNDNGAGSMRQALDDARDSGGGNIVFRVSGIIDLQAHMRTGLRNVTIYGQSAPVGGIALSSTTKGGPQEFGFWQSNGNDSENIIMRYIRVRPNLNPYPNDCCDSFSMSYAANYIIDHCSFSFGTDESVNHGIGSDITWQRNLFGENAKGMIMGDQATKAYDNFSFIQNVFFNTSHRFPNIHSNGRVDLINNLVWNYHSRMSASEGSFELNQIGNFYEYDPNDGDPTMPSRGWMWTDTGHGDPLVFTDNNYHNLGVVPNDAADNWAMWYYFDSGSVNSDQLPTSMQTDTQYPLIGEPFTIMSANETKSELQDDAGAGKVLDASGNIIAASDALDTKYLNHISNNEHPSWSHPDLNDSAHHDAWIAGVGQVINTHPADYDTDNDGMPDAWETATYGDLSTTHSDDTDNDGYTNLEEYMHLVDGPVTQVDVTGVTVSPSTATINIPETITLTRTIAPSNATNQSGTWTTSNAAIATVNSGGVVTPVSEGEVTITFTSSSGGLSDSATITVTNIPIGVESVSLSPETLDLNINATDSVVATILPSNASDQTGTFTSSNPGVATVDQQGLVQPIAVGTTTITFTTNDGGFTDSSVVTINDDNFGEYEFYNADTDILIDIVEGGEVFDLDQVGENMNFRIIPFGGDANPEVESVGITWAGTDNGNYGESSPLYAGLTGHIGNDYQPYTVLEGTYNFTVTYYSGDQQTGSVVAVDTFEVNFTRGEQVNAGSDVSICEGDTAALTASDADSYLWSTGETTATIAVTPNTTTTYTVTGTHSNGNVTTTDSVTVTVNENPTVSAGADQTICSGESVVLTATASIGTFVWSTGETTASITVNPTTTTNYTVTANNNGCIATDDVTVSVNSNPIADAGNDVTISDGDSVTLTASGGGTYAWSTGETTQSITVSPTATTTYNVTVTNANGCTDTDSVEVSVVAPVVANAGQDIAICEGETVTLTASGGNTYLWNTGETTASINVNPENTTVYTVTVSNAISSDTDSVTVIVNPVPVVSAGEDVTINEGENVTLYASGGNNYLWSTGETNANISVSPSQTTTYTVTTTINGCSDTDEVTVTVINLVQANAGEDQETCLGGEVTLTASGGDNYLWSNGETTQSITVSPDSDTQYTVTVTNQYGTDTDDVRVTVNECAAMDFEFRAFPNPSGGNLNVRISGLTSTAHLVVADMIGNKMREYKVEPSGGQTINLRVDLRAMSKGLYLLTLYGDDRQVTRKIIRK